MMNIRGKLAAALSLNMLMWLIMLLLFAGLLGCAAALDMALAIIWPPAVAMLVASLALLAVCTTLALCLKHALRPSQPAPQSQPPSREPDIDQVIEDHIRPVMGDRAADWTRQHTELAIFGAVATGLVLGASPRLRRIVMRATEPVLGRAFSRAVKDMTDKQ